MSKEIGNPFMMTSFFHSLLNEETIKSFEEICNKIKQRGLIISDDLQQITHLLGDRANKALELVSSSRVKLYRFSPSNTVRWKVVGREGEYLVLPSAMYCSCEDWYYSFMKGEKPICVHLIAQKLAEATGDYREFLEEDKDFVNLTGK